jgi:hypothetical protein
MESLDIGAEKGWTSFMNLEKFSQVISIQVGSVALRRPDPRSAGRTIARLNGARTPQRGIPYPEICFGNPSNRVVVRCVATA